jgi:hypothetical protein
MKTRSLLMTGAVCVATIGCPDLSGGAGSLALGVHPAQAKDFYTRKRIDGRWVTGVFPKKGTKLEAEMKAKEVAQPKEAVQQEEAPQQNATAAPERPTLLGLNILGVDLAYRPSIREQVKEIEAARKAAEEEKDRKLTASIRTASYTGTTRPAAKATSRLIEGTPGVQDKPDSESKPARKVEKMAAKDPQPKQEAEPRRKPVAQSSAEARRRADAEFTAAVTRPGQPAEPAVPVAFRAYAPMQERNDLLSALQRKARAMAEEVDAVTGTVGPQVRIAIPGQAVGAQVQPAGAAKPIRTVTIDYENGIRTTIYQDGSIDEDVVLTKP